MSLYEISVECADGTTTTLEPWRGQVLLLVNTASACGFTPQYEGLQALQQRFGEQGFSVLAFPCNQFGAQEPASNAEIQGFCTTRFGVTFPVFAKLEVNGDGAHPLYQYLKAAAPGILGSEAIKWNFTKFLVNRQGEVVDRYAPTTTPEKLADIIAQLLES
ncbi:MAG: glutathione peroxidase [Gammaproteobacteria bacterium]|nr:glutathione peroxidase [Gammaproteobacteria bacterium]